MRTCRRLPILSLTALLILLYTVCSSTATACPADVGGPSSFTAPPGGSQSQVWTIANDFGGGSESVTITSGSDVFSVDQSRINVSSSGTATFTIIFKPGANATGTFKGTFTTSACPKTFALVGTVSTSGVANSVTGTVSFTITPNPGKDNFNILSSGVRTGEIGIYDLLGKEIASSKTTTWKWDASGIAAGSYIVRIAGESYLGEQFAISRRIIITR